MRELLHGENAQPVNEGLLDTILGEPEKAEESDLKRLVGKEVEFDHEELGRFKATVKGYLDRKSTYALFVSIPDELRNSSKIRDYMAPMDEKAKAGLNAQGRYLKIKPEKVREGKMSDGGEKISEDGGNKPQLTFEKFLERKEEGSKVNEDDKKKKIDNKEDFVKYVKEVLKKAHGDDYDENKAEEMAEGLLTKSREKGWSWDQLVGVVQNSLGS